jgi:hypothetical protein
MDIGPNVIVKGGGTEVRKTISVKLDEKDLVITNSKKSRYYQDTKATVCLTSSLEHLAYGDYRRVIIDINIPTVKTQRFRDLVRLCTGRSVMVVSLVYEQDRQALSRIVADTLNCEIVQVTPHDVESMLAALQPEAKTRWCTCPECGAVNQAKNRSKENPWASVICVGCYICFPATVTNNWLE